MDEQQPTTPLAPPTSPSTTRGPATLAPPAGTGTPLPPPLAPRWRLARSRNGVIGGVAAGVSTATGVDATLVRLAFIATALTGFGLVAYLILWLIVPKEDVAAGRVMAPAPPETARWLRIALVAVPGLSIMGLLGNGGPWFLWRGAGWGVALVVIGVVVIVVRRRSGDPTTPTSRAWWESAPQTATAPAARPASVAPATAAALSPTRTPTALLLARVFAWLAVIGAIGTAAVLIVLERIDALSIQAPWLIVTGGVLAIAVIAVAAIMSATAGPVLASTALLLVPAALVVGLGGWNGGVGDRSVAPATVAEVEPAYRLAVGRLTVDLSTLALDGATVPVTAGARIGSLEVVVPAGATVNVSAHTGAGQVDVLGRKADGLDARQNVVDTTADATGTIHLDLDVAAGRILLCRVPAAGTTPTSECRDLLTRTGPPRTRS